MIDLKTIGALRDSGYRVLPVKDELRKNLIGGMKEGATLFSGIVGYDDTVIPDICNAILSRHDFILLGLRGQAKSRILRGLVGFLDEYIPVIKDCEINDSPFAPVCKQCRDRVEDHSDEVEIEWLHREERFGEKLATPDVTIADLIGDIDPIKAATRRLHYAHEGAIHFGIIPRTNRGIFAINELPDLQPRIQVGLLNIMEEKDIQVRGFPIRIPLDVLLVYSANPEDYTNRGNIITPLRDRIGSQIHTHYPRTLEEGIHIARQEAWTDRGQALRIPRFMYEIVESVAVEARESDFVDQRSGVSVRMSITALENLISNAERRSIVSGENEVVPRILDMYALVPAVAGKVELVYEGEQEGPVNVARALIGKAVKRVFLNHFPDPHKSQKSSENPYEPVVSWFRGDNVLDLTDEQPAERFYDALRRVPGLEKLARAYLPPEDRRPEALAVAMEFVLDGLHHHSMLSKHQVERRVTYSDFMDSVFSSLGSLDE